MQKLSVDKLDMSFISNISAITTKTLNTQSVVVQNQKGKGDGVIIEDFVDSNKPQKSKPKSLLKSSAVSKMSKNPIY